MESTPPDLILATGQLWRRCPHERSRTGCLTPGGINRPHKHFTGFDGRRWFNLEGKNIHVNTCFIRAVRFPDQIVISHVSLQNITQSWMAFVLTRPQFTLLCISNGTQEGLSQWDEIMGKGYMTYSFIGQDLTEHNLAHTHGNNIQKNFLWIYVSKVYTPQQAYISTNI